MTSRPLAAVILVFWSSAASTQERQPLVDWLRPCGLRDMDVPAWCGAYRERRLIGEFISRGTAEQLDASCVKDTKRPAFVVDQQIP